MSRDYETLYYEQQAQHTEARGILAQERDHAKGRAERAEASAVEAQRKLHTLQELFEGLQDTIIAEREKHAATVAYAERLKPVCFEVAQEMRGMARRLKEDGWGATAATLLVQADKLSTLAALAKNPAPAGSNGDEASGDPATTVAGPAGQRDLHSVFRAEAREVWTTITGNGPGLWKDYDLQSVETLEKALQRAATLSQLNSPLVPWVPTDNMLEAAALYRQECQGLGRPVQSSGVWQAMLAATGCAYEPPAGHVQSKASES